MTPEEKAELAARRLVTDRRLGFIEARVQRRLIAATLPGGLEEYWRLVEAEIRKP